MSLKGAETLPRLVLNFKTDFSKLQQCSKELNIPKQRKQTRYLLDRISVIVQKILKTSSSYEGDDKYVLIDDFQDIHAQFKALSHVIRERLEQTVEETHNREEEVEVQQSNQAVQIVDQETQETEYLERESKQILEDVKMNCEMMDTLKTEIDHQHEALIRVDSIIEETKDTMEKGNKELEIARENQQKCSI